MKTTELSNEKWGALIKTLDGALSQSKSMIQQALIQAALSIAEHGNARRMSDLFGVLEGAGRTANISHIKAYVEEHVPALKIEKGNMTCAGWKELRTEALAKIDAMEDKPFYSWQRPNKKDKAVGFVDILKRIGKMDAAFDKDGPANGQKWDRSVLKRKAMLHKAFTEFEAVLNSIMNTAVEEEKAAPETEAAEEAVTLGAIKGERAA